MTGTAHVANLRVSALRMSHPAQIHNCATKAPPNESLSDRLDPSFRGAGVTAAFKLCAAADGVSVLGEPPANA